MKESTRTARCLRVLSAASLAVVLLAAPLGAQVQQREVTLGGLFPLSGQWDAIGQCSAIAMQLAVEDVNRYLEGNAAGIRFAAAIEDTHFDPATALEKARMLQARGVRLMIGPQSSAELANVRDFADRNELLLVSHASTAGSLAIAGDNIFRFTPSDQLEATAITTMMWEDGIRAVIPVWRDDEGNRGLEAATRSQFTRLGGTTLNGVHYSPAMRDFAPTLRALKAEIEMAAGRYGAGRVAVFATGFEEGESLFAAASGDRMLSSVRWYGSDGAAQHEGIVANSRAADFAARVGYPSPVFALDLGARDIWQPLHDRIKARTDHEPSAFAYAVYDAVWTVARAYVASGATQDRAKLRNAFTTAAASGYGATGWTVLNEAGDRRYGDFDFWAVVATEGKPRWVRVARFESRTGRMTR